MLRVLVSVATYIGILNTIITILYSHRQGRNIILSININSFIFYLYPLELGCIVSTSLGYRLLGTSKAGQDG